MPSPLFPFQAHVYEDSRGPWLMRLGQGVNEAIFFGSGKPQDEALSERVKYIMQLCDGNGAPKDAKDDILAQLMAMSLDIEYLILALEGERLALDDWRGFSGGMRTLASNLVAALDGRAGPVSQVVQERLQEAQFRWRTNPPVMVQRAVPVEYLGLPEAISMPYRHRIFKDWLDIPEMPTEAVAHSNSTGQAPDGPTGGDGGGAV